MTEAEIYILKSVRLAQTESGAHCCLSVGVGDGVSLIWGHVPAAECEYGVGEAAVHRNQGRVS